MEKKEMQITKSNNENVINRRRFLKTSIGACALSALPLAISLSHAKILQPMERKLAFHNFHTGERIQSVYWAEGQYIPEALQSIRNILRDHRTGDLHKMDTELFNLLHRLQNLMNANQEFHVISAYRSPKTNAMLAGRSDGVAKQSWHTQGKAIDIRLPGHKLADLRAAALSLIAGGVGYYPKSDFIHIDTGHTRSWGG
jgi:uncharacterized protein YcbK (DUF882 family)